MNKQMGNKRKQAAEWIYQYRFALAFILLILLVSFKMNGSSMGCWRVFLGDAPTGVLLGVGNINAALFSTAIQYAWCV